MRLRCASLLASRPGRSGSEGLLFRQLPTLHTGKCLAISPRIPSRAFPPQSMASHARTGALFASGRRNASKSCVRWRALGTKLHHRLDAARFADAR